MIAQGTSDLSIDQIAIPEGVREVIGRRLGRLSDDANLILSVASVIGPDFDLELLLGVSGLDDEAVLMAPYASRGPFHMLLAPRRDRARPRRAR